jgi:outer membrane protein TolC
LRVLLERTVAEYKKTQAITENQYQQGTVSRSDVIQAQTQVKTAKAQLINVGVQRAEFEHAIAVLMGRPPAELTIRRAELRRYVPIVPPDIPSVLMERRPDIAGDERRIAAQNALIGVAVTAYFPDITLSGFYGWVGPQLIPIRVANEVWQIAGQATETVIDGGLRRAEVAAAEAKKAGAVTWLITSDSWATVKFSGTMHLIRVPLNSCVVYPRVQSGRTPIGARKIL